MTNTKRSGGWGVLAGLVGAACTIDNPAFDPDGGATTGGSGVTTGSTGEPPATTGGPGGQDVGETVDDDSAGSEGAEDCVDDADCDDLRYCTGVETCSPGSPDADDLGCVPGVEPCPRGTSCVEEERGCVSCEVDSDVDDDTFPSVDCVGGTDCDDGDPLINPLAEEVCDRAHVDEDCNPNTFGRDADEDGLEASECCNLLEDGTKCGADCDDGLGGITFPGSDWAHCAECGEECGALQACQLGACIDARRVFVTSETYAGDMGGLQGLEGADLRCQELADSMDLGGTFRAYLVDGTVDLAERLVAASVPYVRLDGIVVATNWQDLAERGLLAPIFIDELRERHDAMFERAWTGLDQMLDADCASWTSPKLGLGSVGTVAANDASWRSNGFQQPCSIVARLYCIEVEAGG